MKYLLLSLHHFCFMLALRTTKSNVKNREDEFCFAPCCAAAGSATHCICDGNDAADNVSQCYRECRLAVTLPLAASLLSWPRKWLP